MKIKLWLDGGAFSQQEEGLGKWAGNHIGLEMFFLPYKIEFVAFGLALRNRTWSLSGLEHKQPSTLVVSIISEMNTMHLCSYSLLFYRKRVSNILFLIKGGPPYPLGIWLALYTSLMMMVLTFPLLSIASG